MTTMAVTRRKAITVSDQTHGWLASVLLHGLGIAASLLVVEAMEPRLPPSLFQWEIPMVEAPTRTESQSAEPVVQPPPPTVKPSPPVRQTKPMIAEQPPAHQEVTVPVETTRMVKDVVANAEPVMEYAPVASTESEPLTSPSVVEATMESSEQPVIEQSAPVESVASHTEHRLVEYRQVRHRETRADYGWLRDALWGRIEELKRYPALARTNHWEGKVVVSAVIRDDGEVMGVQIAETSGRAVLDEEAMAVMKKASPLRLKHPLGQRQITILVPINYRLDG
jgi:periplasmic protein TonB